MGTRPAAPESRRTMPTAEAVEGRRDPHPRAVDQRRAQLRRRLRRADRRDPAQHRGDRPRRAARACRKIAVHWPLIDFECGPTGGADDFLEWFFKADRGELEPFVLVVEGSIPNEKLHDEGYWCGFGNDPATGQPMTTSEWLDRLAPEGHRGRRGRHLRHLRRHPRDGRQPDRRDGRARLPRLGLEVQGRHPDRLRARAARSSPTTCPRRSPTCSTWPPARRR